MAGDAPVGKYFLQLDRFVWNVLIYFALLMTAGDASYRCKKVTQMA